MSLLILSIGLELGAPLFYHFFSSRALLKSITEKVIGVAMVFILVVHVLPESIEAGGPIVLLAAAGGFILVIMSEKLPALAKYGAFHATLFLAFAGLAIHSMIDGLALFLPDLAHAGHEHHHHGGGSALSLAWAVILHRLPVAMFIWGYFSKKFSGKVAYMVLLGMSAATLIGFLSAEQLHAMGEWDEHLAWIQAFVAGSLLHIVLDPWLHKHEGDHAHDHAHGHSHAHSSEAPA